MQYALINDKRQKPFPGGKGICPKCQRDVVARCGDINIWHWAHQQSCEPWSEPETEWHLGWKSYFPEDWQEVIIENEQTSITHRADVKTPEGLVIEFQNSSISSSEIQAREEFYQNIIWIVNAINFKDNFKIRSLVKKKLNNLKLNTDKRKEREREFFSKQLENAGNKLSLLEKEVSTTERNIKGMEEQFCKYLEYLNYLDRISEIIINNMNKIKSHYDLKISTNADFIADILIKETKIKGLSQYENMNHFISYRTQALLKEINNIFLMRFIELNTSIKSLQDQYFILDKQRKYLLELPDPDFLPNSLPKSKVIPFEKIETNSLSNIKCIETQTKFTFFPVIHEMTEGRLAAFALQAKYKSYEFLVDINTEIEKIDEQMNLIQIDMDQKLLFRDHEIAKEVRDFIENWIISRIENTGLEINEFNIQLDQKRESFLQEGVEFKKLENEILSKLNQELQKIQNCQKEEEFRIMREYKGLYDYTWSYQRKTWQFAKRTVYFDFGNETLFERTENGLFRKITRQDFLSHYLVTEV